MNGFRCGNISISMDDGHVEHGKRTVVDTSNDSKADNETLAAFGEVYRHLERMYEGAARSIVRMLVILSNEE